MKHFYGIVLCLTTSALYGMETPNSLHYQHAINDKKNFYAVALCNNKLFIAGTNGIDVYNNTTKSFTKLSDQSTFSIAKHPSTNHLAVSQEKELAIYDTETEKKIWSGNPVSVWRSSSIIFDQKTLTIYAYDKGQLTLHNLKHPLTFIVPFDRGYTSTWNQISWHPTKKTLSYPSATQIVSIIDPRNAFTVTKNITFPAHSHICNVQYNHDGSHMAIKDNKKKCCLYNLHTNSIGHSFPSQYHALEFHPQQNMIALLNTDGLIEYWNCKTTKIIAITKNYHKEPSIKKIFSRTKRLDFSNDGKYLGVALAKTFLLLSAPINNINMILYLLSSAILPPNNFLQPNNDIAKVILSLIPHLLEMDYFDFVELSKI